MMAIVVCPSWCWRRSPTIVNQFPPRHIGDPPRNSCSELRTPGCWGSRTPASLRLSPTRAVGVGGTRRPLEPLRPPHRPAARRAAQRDLDQAQLALARLAACTLQLHAESRFHRNSLTECRTYEVTLRL